MKAEDLLKKKWVLRIGMAVTFIWIGIMVLQEPLVWSSYLQPWAANLIPTPIEQAMRTNGVFDIIVGAMFLVTPLAFIAGILGTIHLTMVLVVSGINEATVRDIGLLAASIFIALVYFPRKKK